MSFLTFLFFLLAQLFAATSVDAKSTRFPTPKCLEKNVVFWESVYRDLGKDEAYLHDRWHMDRVLAKITLPKNRRMRRRVKANVRKSYSKLLTTMAKKIRRKQKLSKREVKFLALFPKNKATHSEISKTAQSLRIQTGLKKRFVKGIRRSLRYLPLIQAILQKRKVPVELAFLPHVESSFYPFAKSHSGAVGLWQIMPGTMRHLMGSRAVRKRTHVGTATIAAAKLLRQNYVRTRSWPLAITAYNHGLNGIMRGVKRTRSQDLCQIIAKYRSRTFGFASRNFYAQFLAAINVAFPKYQGLAKSGRYHRKILKPLLAVRRGNSVQ